MTTTLRAALFALLLFSLFSCEKTPAPVMPDPVYEVFVKNDFVEIQARYAIFISNKDGETLAFQWLPGEDTAHVQVPKSTTKDHYDCTILKLTTLEAPGTGVKDTALTLTTYTNLPSGENINLRDLYFHQVTDLQFTLAGITSLDSIVVSDGLALSRPQASNNFYGRYLVNNSGHCWLRVLVNGEHFWRFIVFKNISETLEINSLDVSQMLFLLSPPVPMEFPFLTNWQFKLDGAVDTAQYQFFPLSEHIRAPGGPVPVYNSREIFEPVNNGQFDPNRPYIDLFRLQTTGPSNTAGGYTYLSDNFYGAIPASLPEPDFDLAPSVVADNSVIAVQCIGDFDLLAFSRTRNGTPDINWEVLIEPISGVMLYRLPTVPKPLADLYPALKNYNFNTTVRARAERYERLDYEQILHQRLLNADPLWRARAGYLAREEAF